MRLSLRPFSRHERKPGIALTVLARGTTRDELEQDALRQGREFYGHDHVEIAMSYGALVITGEFHASVVVQEKKRQR
jgi:hypothetical protein